MQTINLKASNQKYVSAENVGAQPLVANRDKALSWETFKLHRFNADANMLPAGFDQINSTYLIQAVNNKYVSYNNPDGTLIANSDHPGYECAFVLESLDGGIVTLKGLVNHRYVSYHEGNDILYAGQSNQGENTEFAIVYV